MLIEFMFFEISKLITSIITYTAFVGLFTGVNHFMNFEISVGFKCLITKFALERSLITMISFMPFEAGGGRKRFFTFVTFVWFFSRMSSFMQSHTFLEQTGIITLIAMEDFFFQMNTSDMILQRFFEMTGIVTLITFELLLSMYFFMNTKTCINLGFQGFENEFVSFQRNYHKCYQSGPGKLSKSFLYSRTCHIYTVVLLYVYSCGLSAVDLWSFRMGIIHIWIILLFHEQSAYELWVTVSSLFWNHTGHMPMVFRPCVFVSHGLRVHRLGHFENHILCIWKAFYRRV